LHPRPGDADSLKQHFPSIDTSWTTIYYPTRKGESVDGLVDRIHTFSKAFFTALSDRIPSAGKRKRVAMFTHAGAAIALVRNLVGDRHLRIKAGCCSISELVRKERVTEGDGVFGAYDPVKLVSGDHLEKGSDRAWGFDHIEVDKGKVRASILLQYRELIAHFQRDRSLKTRVFQEQKTRKTNLLAYKQDHSL
jgi:transcription factor C subunit 7